MRKFWIGVMAVACLAVGGAMVRAQDSTAAGGISGKWHFVLDTPGGDREFDADFTVDADGKIGGTFGKSTAIGTFKDGKLDMDFPAVDEDSSESSQLKLAGKLDDAAATLTGTWQFSSYDGTFRAFRPKKAE